MMSENNLPPCRCGDPDRFHSYPCRPPTTLESVAPCPFCGGSPIADRTLRGGYENDQEDQDAWAHFLRCHACGACGGWAKTAAGARRLWNMRADEWDNAVSDPLKDVCAIARQIAGQKDKP